MKQESTVDQHQAFSQRCSFLTRLMMGNGNSLSDVELLEMMLTPVAVAPHNLAIRLMERFASLHKVIDAEEFELRAVEGVDDGVIQSLMGLRLLNQRMLKSKIADRPVILSWTALMDYCKLTMANNKVEEFRVLFLNSCHVLIADEVMHRGTINHTPVYPREVVKRGLELSAMGVILLHSHPSGDPTPSKADIDVTRQIVAAAATMNITVYDHVIISENGTYSFRADGLIGDDTETSLEVPSKTQYSLL